MKKRNIYKLIKKWKRNQEQLQLKHHRLHANIYELMNNWSEIYRRLAELFSVYYNVHRKNAGKDLYQRCIRDSEFVKNNKWILKFNEVYKIQSIDPIHIFSSINESIIDTELRIRRINCLFKILSKKVKYDKIDFTGCPLPFSIKILSAREEIIQNEIWNVFNEVVRKNQNAMNQSVFDKLTNWYGVDISAFTIFLFWIDSSNFLPLDKNTNKYLLEKKVLKRKPKTFREYKNLLRKKNTDAYRIITRDAYDKRKHSKESISSLSMAEKFFREIRFIKTDSIDFKIIAIKPLDGLNEKFSKVLQPNQVYTFYTAYDLANTDVIKYDPKKDLKIYRYSEVGDSLDVNISAIVGKNGSGKSSIIELFYLAINNFTKEILASECELEKESNINLELFFFTDTVYKLQLLNDNITLHRYENSETYFSNAKPENFDRDYLGSFFYTLAINYSHYALNSKDLGGWVQNLFHKNDAYQAPLVINPMRTEGNIDINKENDFVKSRMLANILEPEIELRVLTENNRSAEILKYSLNEEKVKFLFDKVRFPKANYRKEILAKVYKHFAVHITKQNKSTKCADKYIFKKLVTISRNYPHYKKYYNEKAGIFKLNLFEKYLKLLEEDLSHITNKLKQAINFLKYPHLKHHDIVEPITVQQLSDNIQKVITENYSKEKIRTIELIPPAFFKIDIELNDKSDFAQLSSGEKQRIYTLNTLVYHLLNINSVSDSSDLIKYNYVNILFDEVELYFHPEMQRTFIDFLLRYLRKVNFNDITGLNFCFVTHSPFILSDIPDSNIMFLEINEKSKMAEQKFRDEKTLGGNIHDMLKDSFFLKEGYMGEFAKNKIKSAISYLEGIKNGGVINETEKEQEWTQDSVSDFIDIVGEPLLRNSLRELYLQAFVINDKAQLEKEIARLQEQKNKLG